ncbi:MAG: hypothetical protein R3B91_09955 [Planctomycetaceae bacterium]
MAACYRRLGDITEASRRYRQLVTIADTTLVGDLSRWWLNIIDTQQTLSNTTNELDAVIKQLQESVYADIDQETALCNALEQSGREYARAIGELDADVGPRRRNRR